MPKKLKVPEDLGAAVPTGVYPFTTADVHAPAANTAAVVTYAANATKRHILQSIAYSYVGGTPVGGNIKVQDGTDVVFTQDIATGGSGVIEFPVPKHGSMNKAMVITLAAGGSGVTGKVSVLLHRLV